LDPDEKGKVCKIRRALHLGGIYGYSSVAGETTQETATGTHAIETGRIALVVVLGLNPISGADSFGDADFV
jgi:hypothetical protein